MSKRYYIPRHARDKAWAHCMASADTLVGEKPTVRVAIINGMHGGLICDKVYSRRPANAICYFTKYDDYVSPLRWEMVR